MVGSEPTLRGGRTWGFGYLGGQSLEREKGAFEPEVVGLRGTP